MTIAEFSTALGINNSTFYKKSRELGTSFTALEIKRMISLLGIKKSDVMPIFFDELT